MAGQSPQIVQKLWNYCNVLRDDGMSYGDYVEQLTYLLFLKMADERTKPPYNQPGPIPNKYSWPSLLKRDGDELFDHYRHSLEKLGNEKGLLGLIFNKSQNKFQDPAKLRRLIVDLIDKEDWSAMSADVKGDAYEGLLQKNAEGCEGRGRPILHAATADSSDGGLCRAETRRHDLRSGLWHWRVSARCARLCGEAQSESHQAAKEKAERRDIERLRVGAERCTLCAMNLLLHGIGSQDFEPVEAADSLASDPGERFNSY